MACSVWCGRQSIRTYPPRSVLAVARCWVLMVLEEDVFDARLQCPSYLTDTSPPPPHRLPSHVAVIRFCIFATINRMYTQGSAYYADIPCTINSRACLHLQDGLSMLASHVFYVPRHLPHEVEADTKSGKVATYLTFG